MKLTYYRNGDYLLPDLAVNETDQQPLGKYGMLRLHFLQAHRPVLYNELLLSVITLPFEIAEKPAEKAEATIASIRGLHLLLAEDNQLNAKIPQTLFTDKGAQVTLAENGREVVDMFRSHQPGSFDAILMDIMMPELDGLQATQAIRALARPDAKTIPIIAMTANAFAEDAEKCLAAGMNAFLTKPLEIEKAVQTIAQQCGRKEA